jgi:dolichol kinase
MNMDDREVRREIFHIILGIIIIGLTLVLGRTWMLIGSTLILILGLVFSRLSMHKDIPILCWFIECFDREEFVPGKGAFAHLLGSTLALALFPLKIALASIIFLAFMDGFATLIGRTGKLFYAHSKKTIEGTVSGGIIGIFGAMMFIAFLPSLFAGIIAMMIESFDHPYFLDDNWIVPLVFGLVAVLVV